MTMYELVYLGCIYRIMWFRTNGSQKDINYCRLKEAYGIYRPYMNVDDKKIYSLLIHYIDFIMDTMASQTISFMIVYSTVCLGADERKHERSASLAFVRGIHRRPVNSPHKGPVTRKIFPSCRAFYLINIHSCLLRFAWLLSQILWTDVMDVTHWGRDKMAAVSQTTFSNAFFEMKMN